MKHATHRIITIAALIITALTLAGATTKAPEGVSGSIYFRDGRIIEFSSLGGVDFLKEYVIHGKLGLQDVAYKFSEVAQIEFPNKEATFYSSASESEAIIVSRSGNRFTLNDVYFKNANTRDTTQAIDYVYLDPVTNERRRGNDAFRDISHIELGEHAGRWKHNPRNNAYFPSNYNFDPFTGDKLEWIDEPQPTDDPDTP
jgi:hypothetical protein